MQMKFFVCEPLKLIPNRIVLTLRKYNCKGIFQISKAISTTIDCQNYFIKEKKEPFYLKNVITVLTEKK